MRALKLLGTVFLALMLLVVIAAIVFFNTARGRAMLDTLQAVGGSDELDGGAVDSAEDVLHYLQAHPDRYAMALWNVGDEAHGFFHDADAPWPLASTVKLIPLTLAQQELSAGRWQLNTPTPEVEMFHFPGTDGNAHMRALASIDGGTSSLGGALQAMIRYSDNAATDAILLRLGRDRVEQGSTALEIEGLQAPHPLCGEMLLAKDAFDGGSGPALESAAWRRAEDVRDNETQRVHWHNEIEENGLGLSIVEQQSMARNLDNRGSARAYAKLMERLFGQDTQQTAFARSVLSWTMAAKSNQTDFHVLATKGGSLASVLTSATYAESKTGQKRVLALFFHDLPFGTWLAISSSFAEQKLERELLLDQGAIERMTKVLSPSR
jgi:D-alanyl-D-alanine carboxypeptidase